jgi:hypothetical protein
VLMEPGMDEAFVSREELEESLTRTGPWTPYPWTSPGSAWSTRPSRTSSGPCVCSRSMETLGPWSGTRSSWTSCHPSLDGPVWFSFFLTSFSENLAVERIWLWGESKYHYDYVWRKVKLFIGLRI